MATCESDLISHEFHEEAQFGMNVDYKHTCALKYEIVSVTSSNMATCESDLISHEFNE
jgi:hypothetical protein